MTLMCSVETRELSVWAEGTASSSKETVLVYLDSNEVSVVWPSSVH